MAWKPPGVGQMRHRVTIQSLTESTDSVGQPVQAWADSATVWGLVEPVGVLEGVSSRQMLASASHRVTIRAFASVTAKMRCLWDGLTLGVVGVERPHSAWLVLACGGIADEASS